MKFNEPRLVRLAHRYRHDTWKRGRRYAAPKHFRVTMRLHLRRYKRETAGLPLPELLSRLASYTSALASQMVRGLRWRGNGWRAR